MSQEVATVRGGYSDAAHVAACRAGRRNEQWRQENTNARRRGCC